MGKVYLNVQILHQYLASKSEQYKSQRKKNTNQIFTYSCILTFLSFPFLILIFECPCLHLQECYDHSNALNKSSVCGARDGTQSPTEAGQFTLPTELHPKPQILFSNHYTLENIKLPWVFICFMMLEIECRASECKTGAGTFEFLTPQNALSQPQPNTSLRRKGKC